MVTVAKVHPGQEVLENTLALGPAPPEQESSLGPAVERPVDEANPGLETEQDLSAEHNEVQEEAELVVHPFNTPLQVVGLCQRLKLSLRAEIIHVVRSLPGTVIRLSCRSEQGVLEYLREAEEVAEVWEEKISVEARTEFIPGSVESHPVMEDGLAKVVCVALKPA